jgi:glycosyltransferase involved in cell wall biosynthesis
MKVLMINSFNYLRGGGERCFFDLSELLMAHGHEVIPFCMAHPQNLSTAYDRYFPSRIDFPAELAKTGLMPSLQVTGRVFYSREARRNIEQLIADTRPDLVHIHGFIHEMSTSVLPPLKAAGLPVIQTLHDYKIVCPNTTFVSHGQVCERCKGHRYYNIVRQRCKRGSLPASLLAGLEMYFHEFFQLYEPNIDLFISPSRFLRDKLVEHGIKKPIVVIPNFINPDHFQPYFEPENYFVYAGRLVAVKGVLTLLEAMRHLKTDAQLYLVGAGELEEEAKRFVADHGLSNVRFVGHLNTARLIHIVQRAAFAIVPSEWYENYSMTVIEAFACGTAVVGAAIGGIPEQVCDGWNGLLFEPGSAQQLVKKMQFLLEHRQEAIQMGRNGRKQVEEMNDPESHYEQTMAIYRRHR